MIDENKLRAWLCLKHAPEIGFKTAIKIIESYGSPEDFVGNKKHVIYSSGELSSTTKEYLINAVQPSNINQILKLMDTYSISFVTLLDNEYPENLKYIYAPPLILYYRGEFSTAMMPYNLAVVGTRKPTAYGREMTKGILTPLIQYGFCITSGLAIGIDTISHITALENAGKTIAVLGSGCDMIYPSLNRALAKQIIENGMVLSEYEPGTKVEKWNFPARNRIISALANGVLVMEGSMSSGSMLTAKFAIEQSRPIFALPGNINCQNAQGPNYLIKNGAALITCTEDILEAYGIDSNLSQQTEIFPELSPTEQLIYDIFKQTGNELSIDDILIKTLLPIGKISVAILNLELKRLIIKASSNCYMLK